MSYFHIHIQNENKNCFFYDHSPKPQIELMRFKKGQAGKLTIQYNDIIFFIEGRISYKFRNSPEDEGLKGQIIFLPSGCTFSYAALDDSLIMIFRLHDPVSLCDTFPLEELYGLKEIGPLSEYSPRTETMSVLEINPRIWHFIEGVKDCIGDNMKCKHYFKLKIKEFFLLLRIYYTKQQIHDFFYLILSGDTAFSEYIRRNWRKYPTVSLLAASMNYSLKQFSGKFKDVFAKTPNRWIIEGKARLIHHELLTTNKSLKEIAIVYDFKNKSQFSAFCKKELGNTPSEIRKAIKK